MFTGIITETGTVASASRSNVRIRASRALARKLTVGASVAVEGACLTVFAKTRDSFTADIMPETARRTTLGKLRKNDVVNLELSATPSTFLSGHIVQGHVDGIGAVRSVQKDETSRMLSIEVPRPLSRFIVKKGSVAVNGVSFTVINVTAGRFSVGIIPHTRETTSLRSVRVGDAVNIETDIIAKYLQKLI